MAIHFALTVIDHLKSGACCLLADLEAHKGPLQKRLHRRGFRKRVPCLPHAIRRGTVFLKGQIDSGQQTGSLGSVSQGATVLSDERCPVEQVPAGFNIFDKVLTIESPDQAHASYLICRHGVGLVVPAYAQVGWSRTPKGMDTVRLRVIIHRGTKKKMGLLRYGVAIDGYPVFFHKGQGAKGLVKGLPRQTKHTEKLYVDAGLLGQADHL